MPFGIDPYLGALPNIQALDASRGFGSMNAQQAGVVQNALGTAPTDPNAPVMVADPAAAAVLSRAAGSTAVGDPGALAMMGRAGIGAPPSPAAPVVSGNAAGLGGDKVAAQIPIDKDNKLEFAPGASDQAVIQFGKMNAAANMPATPPPAGAPAPFAQPSMPFIPSPVAGGGPAQVIPGHFQTVAYNIQHGKPNDPNALRHYDIGVEAQDTGMQKMQQAQTDALDAIAKVKQDQANLMAHQVAQAQNTAFRQQQAGDDAFRTYQEAAQNFPTSGPDAGRAWRNAGTGGQIAATLGIILGGIGQGLMKGGPNQALDIVQTAIDRDIQSQREEIASKKGKVGELKGAFGTMLAKFGNENQAEAATRALGLQQAIAQGDAIAATYKSPEVDAQWAIDRGKLTQAWALQTNALKQSAADAVQEHVAYIPPKVVGGGAGAPPPEKIDEEKFVPDMGGVAHRKEDAVKATELTRGAASILQDLNEIKTLRATPEDRLTPEIRNRIESAQARLRLHMKDEEGVNRYTDLEASEFNKIAGGDAKAIYNPGAEQALDDYAAAVQRHVQQVAKSYGVTPVQSYYTNDKYGRVVPAMRYSGAQPGAAPPPSFRPGTQ